MTVPLTERYFTPIAVPVVWATFGQTISVPGIGGTPGYTLVCYLTDPLPVRSRVDFVLFCHEDADEFIWTFGHPATKMNIKIDRGDTVGSVTLAAPGDLKIQVEVRAGGATRATVTMTQTAASPGLDFQAVANDLKSRRAGEDMLFALREICEELKQYIDDAASSTGPNGIPARLLAAVLFMEAWGRPKDGSPKSKIIRKRFEGEEYSPRQQAVEEKIKRFFDMKVGKVHLHDIREEELALLRSFFNGIEDYDPSVLFTGRKTLGVGQIAQTTAAMTADKIVWRELTPAGYTTILDAIETDYKALPPSDLLAIFNCLRFPKTNILYAAQLLAKLKNRAHRFPTMSARDVLTTAQAIGIIATEYNRGGFDTPLASMKNNGNGDRAINYVLATKDTIGLTRFFPDPPP